MPDAIEESWAAAIQGLAAFIYEGNVAVGWWDDSTAVRDAKVRAMEGHGPTSHVPPGIPDKYLIPTKIALMHSELSEGLEGFRKGLPDDHLPHRPMIEVEFADTIIRILDTAGHLGLDVGGAIIEKIAYNGERADHKREARNAPGGKSV